MSVVRNRSGKWVTGSPKLRVGLLNIGLLLGKSIELVKILKKNKINITCIQETRCKRLLEGASGGGYEHQWMMMIKLFVGGFNLNVISIYVFHVDLYEEVKKLFWEDLNKVERGISNTNKISIVGDFNSYIGETSRGFNDDGGGALLLNFAKAFDLVIANSCFQKREKHLGSSYRGDRGILGGHQGLVVEWRDPKQSESKKWCMYRVSRVCKREREADAGKNGDKKLYRLAKAREIKSCDLDQVKCINDEEGKVFVEECFRIEEVARASSWMNKRRTHTRHDDINARRMEMQYDGPII
ncbi:hypothetical protein H5410_057763 [Solanum commersonii]|uniref:Endonuclease/exonuclease/phosphatase domain-containing protein n=1 Tax=Solanum commersonii TaxID=4109 RepID=A0A9J5WQN6_SOLCO|nr:hypothetical protein H5410_057763 [Solanum commersonii]